MYLEEIWKPVLYGEIKPNMYEVSNMGRFRNKNTGKLLSPCVSEKGYLMVYVMTIYGKGRSIKLHRIVATHFVPGRTKEKCEVDHIDCNKLNCEASNLEWVTHLENIRRAYENNIIPIKRGQDHPYSQLKDDEVHMICELLLKYNGDCCRVYNILKSQFKCNIHLIRGIKYKKSYSHISDLYFKKGQFPKFKKFNDYRN